MLVREEQSTFEVAAQSTLHWDGAVGDRLGELGGGQQAGKQHNPRIWVVMVPPISLIVRDWTAVFNLKNETKTWKDA